MTSGAIDERPLVAIVIVNYNSGPYLARCLEHLEIGCKSVSWEAVVIDNASTDRSEEAAAGLAPRVRLVAAGANLGFARAANEGVRQTSAPLILLLNPDTRLSPGSLLPLVAELTEHPECDIVAPAVINEDGTPQGNARGDPTMLTGVFGRTSLVRRLFPKFPLVSRDVIRSDFENGATGREVDWVSGSCCLNRRQAFERVGGFDERYFLYWEDADLCRRIRKTGGTVRFRPDNRSPVVHAVGKSSATARDLAVRSFHESAYRYYATHIAPSKWNPSRWLAWTLLMARRELVRRFGH
jgi:GT2 family glycosyltransferase